MKPLADKISRHCPGGAGEVDCGLRDREFNVGFRVGSLFIILVTSMLGVFAPLLFQKLPFGSASNWVLMILKQFGTGIIISTAFIHVSSASSLLLRPLC
jgi:zinc transporter 1/2/3